jgi:predicted DNA-binding transcriptional regulator AlpA
MSAQNIQLARLALTGLSARDRADLIRELSDMPARQEPDRLLRPKEAAKRLGMTPRSIFNLLKSGALTRIRLPGRKRGLGIRNSEIDALIEGGAK